MKVYDQPEAAGTEKTATDATRTAAAGTALAPPTPDELAERERRVTMNTYGRDPVKNPVLVKGEGWTVWDVEGRAYLDLVSGLSVHNVGHSHPRVLEAIERQAGLLLHTSNLYYTLPQIELAEQLVERSCAGRVFFCNSGAEANEAAIKLARKYAADRFGPQKHEIIAFERSFHGRTFGALSATGQTKYHHGFEPLVPGFFHLPYNDLAAVERAAGDRTCAVLVEVVQGEGGVIPGDGGFLRGLRRLCDERGILLILDEVQCGLGRTGKLFSYEHHGFEPDIFTLAKSVGGGLPLGAMLAREEVAVFQPGDHASTFGGHPLSCAAGLAALRVIIEDDLPARAAAEGEYLGGRLQELRSRHPVVADVRGCGLMWGMELAEPGAPVVQEGLRRGVLLNCAAGNVIRFLPPLTIPREELDRALALLDDILADLFGNREG